MSETSTFKLTRDIAERGLSELRKYIDTLCVEKYCLADEASKQDILDRIARIVREKGTEFGYKPEDIDAAAKLVSDGYFIPGGSILSGLGNNEIKASLSNCYVVAIKNDSIEAIYETNKRMARTYSYRGGCGTDISILRPAESLVNNAAKTSSGAVSFMPLFSTTTKTIGQRGRRGALMITMDCRHPDIMQFIWCKADPYRVFHIDNLDPIVPNANRANISVKITNDFIQAVKEDRPWVCKFPDIDADKDFYNEHWTGDYENWIACGGKIKEYTTYSAIVTEENRHRFIGSNCQFETAEGQVFAKIVADDYNVDVEKAPRIVKVSDLTIGEHVFEIPTARRILEEISEAAYLRGDPGIMFIDHAQNNSFTPNLHPSLKVISSNPCGEQILNADSNCLLGAHIISKYVVNPWTPDVKFDMEHWRKGTQAAVVLMNIFSDINEHMHPLEEQRNADHFSKRVGIEFVALADAMAMVGFEYDSDNALDLIDVIMAEKAWCELLQSSKLAEQFGPCDVLNREINPTGIDTLLKHPYIQRIFDYAKNTSRSTKCNQLKKEIEKHGLRNAALNTVGPTGSIALLTDNCSSGIEPIFAIYQKRRTRVGEQQEYEIVHAPLVEFLLKYHSEELDTKGFTLEELKERFSYKEAHDIEPSKRVRLQSVVQKWTDSSISSTVNLPSTSTIDDVIDTYMQAWNSQLKGITVYRDGSLYGVIEAITTTAEAVPVEIKIRPMKDVEKCDRHRVVWNGRKIYVMVTVDTETNIPIEIFATLPREIGDDEFGSHNRQVFQEKESLWEAVTRLTSLALRGNLPLEAIIKQLQKSSYVINDPMAIIIRVLSLYMPKDEVDMSNLSVDEIEQLDHSIVCPSCHKKTFINQAGCGYCQNPDCNYHKCG